MNNLTLQEREEIEELALELDYFLKMTLQNSLDPAQEQEIEDKRELIQGSMDAPQTPVTDYDVLVRRINDQILDAMLYAETKSDIHSMIQELYEPGRLNTREDFAQFVQDLQDIITNFRQESKTNLFEAKIIQLGNDVVERVGNIIDPDLGERD
jgi:hypothetical protein